MTKKLTQEMIEARPKPFVGMRVWNAHDGDWFTLLAKCSREGTWVAEPDEGITAENIFLRPPHEACWRLPGEPGCPPDPQLEGYVPRVGDEWVTPWFNLDGSIQCWVRHEYPGNWTASYASCLFTRGGPNGVTYERGIYINKANVNKVEAPAFKVGDRVKATLSDDVISAGEEYTVTRSSISGDYVEVQGRQYWSHVFTLASSTTQKIPRPEILDRAALARQNNQRETCVACGEGLEVVVGFSSTYRVCRRCEG